jgi:type IX secretion system PorP/SprF family membrane protein
MINNYRNSILVLMMILSLSGYSQQEAQHSMYFFNPVLINPGYAGSQEALVATATLRDQWTNFKGAPKTQCLTVHSPLRKENIGLGLTVLNDQLGATKNTSAFADFSYSIRLNQRNHRLVFGLKAGVDYYRTDFSNLKINDNTDNVYTNGFNYSKTMFNMGAGVYYYGKRFYLGASTPRMIKNSLNLPSSQSAYQENHYYLFGGVVIKLNSGINMRPSFIVKYVNNAPLSIDGNLSFLFYDKIWVGAMYRYNSAAGANVMFNVNQNFRIGYAYDYTLNAIQNYSAGSHEIMVSYDLRSKSKGFKSPRYF